MQISWDLIFLFFSCGVPVINIILVDEISNLFNFNVNKSKREVCGHTLKKHVRDNNMYTWQTWPENFFYNNIVAGAYNFCSMHDSCTYVSWHNNIVVGLFLSYLVVGLGLTWHACNEWLEKKQRDVCSVRCRRLFCIVWHKYMCTCYCYVCAGGAMFFNYYRKIF